MTVDLYCRECQHECVCKVSCAPLRIKKALGIYGELIPRTTTRVAFWEPPSGSQKQAHYTLVTFLANTDFGLDLFSVIRELYSVLSAAAAAACGSISKFSGNMMCLVCCEQGLKARGNVEDWLGKVEESMFVSLRKLIRSAMTDYEHKSREEWVLLHSSQVRRTVFHSNNFGAL